MQQEKRRRRRVTPPSYVGGEGTPLVLLHGAAGTWRVWRRTFPYLEPHHAVFAPTLPGHFGAEPLTVGTRVSVDAIADALERQLDAAGLETVHLVGNSLGGWLSLELARRGRARSVVALSPAGVWSTASDMRKLQAKFLVGYRAARVVGRGSEVVARMPGARSVLGRAMAEHPKRIRPSEAAEALRAAAGCHVMPGLLRSAKQDGGIAPGLESLTCPVRIAWAANDRVLPYELFGKPFLTLVPSAVHVTLPSAGHVSMIDQPELISQLVLSVTRGVDA